MRSHHRPFLFICLAGALALLLAGCGQGGSTAPLRTVAPPPGTSSEFVFVTNSVDATVSAFQLETTTGVLTALQSSPFAVTTGASPRAAAVALGKFLYIANQNTNTVTAFAISTTTGALTLVNTYTTGTGPRSLIADPLGKFLYVANFSSANISAFSINASTGELTPIAGSPFGAGGTFYAITVDSAGKFIYVTDNGFLRVYGFAINSTTGALSPVPGAFFAAGSDPLGLAVHPSGKFLYVTDVPGTAGNLLVYTIDVNGALAPITGSPFAVGSEPFAVAIEPTGKFAYVTLNGGPTIAQLSLDPNTGAPTPIGSPAPAINPTEIAIDHSGKFVYVSNPNLNNVSGYLIGTTGTLTPLPFSPYVTGKGPTGIAIAMTQ